MLDLLPVLAQSEGTLTQLAGQVSELAGQFGVKWSTLIAQIINFILVAIVLYYFAFKPIMATLDERKDRIESGLRYAEEMKLKLAETETQSTETLRQASREAQGIIQEARQLAKEAADRQAREAAEKTEHMLSKAREAIELERVRMVAEVREEIARLVVATSAKVLDQQLSESDRGRYLQSAADELSRQRN